MAVLIEGISVVLRVETIRSRYPGGWERFRMDCPNDTLCSDGKLIRVGFMTPGDTQQFVEGLGRFGIEFLRSGRAVDIVVADQQRGFTAPCDWADFGKLWLSADGSKSVAACRARGGTFGELATPLGWEYENSLSADFKFVETGRASEFMDFLRHEDGVDVYRDLATGKEVFVARTMSAAARKRWESGGLKIRSVCAGCQRRRPRVLGGGGC